VRHFFTVVLILATTSTGAIAQTLSPESRTAAVRLVEAMNWREAIEPMRAEMLARTKTYLQARLNEELGSPTREEHAEVEAMVDQLVSKYNLDDTITDLIPLLQAHYSITEMEELATLYPRIQEVRRGDA